MSLCAHCWLADNGCPVYPLETTGCASLKLRVGREHTRGACLLIAGGLRRATDAGDRQRRWELLCRIIEEGV